MLVFVGRGGRLLLARQNLSLKSTQCRANPVEQLTQARRIARPAAEARVGVELREFPDDGGQTW